MRAKDFLAQMLYDGRMDIAAAVRPALIVPASLSALRLLGTLRTSQRHLALVVDEHGSIQGLVTHNEVLEAVAEFADDANDPDPEIVRRDDGTLLLDGALALDELKDVLGVKALPDEEEGHYHTLAGFVLAILGHVPSVAECFEWGGYRFEIVDLDRHRVDKVLVTPLTGDIADEA